ncbi:high mobility group protein B1-like [Rattus rattus]|uniref:high mobility group protein B1-like n=1 Tax=Rattus rattus TaxID=10117 RepID=UPI0013F3479C|nr:high mobility group protein B1-like [Rattus rattus]
MPAKEKGKDMAKADKARYEREMKTYITPTTKGETKKKFQDPKCPQEASFSLFLFCSEYCPKPKASILAYPMEARLKKYERGIAAYRAKGKPDAAKKGVVKAEKSRKKKEEEDDKEDEKDEEEEEEEEGEDEEDNNE